MWEASITTMLEEFLALLKYVQLHTVKLQPNLQSSSMKIISMKKWWKNSSFAILQCTYLHPRLLFPRCLPWGIPLLVFLTEGSSLIPRNWNLIARSSSVRWLAVTFQTQSRWPSRRPQPLLLALLFQCQMIAAVSLLLLTETLPLRITPREHCIHS